MGSNFFKKLLFADEEGSAPEESSKKVEKEKEGQSDSKVKFPNATQPPANSGQYQGYQPTYTNTQAVPFPAQAQPVANNTFGSPRQNQYLQQTVEMFHQFFESLNKDGTDFYEFFKVVSGNINDPNTYKMAMTMFTSLDKTFTKEGALKYVDFYIESINKVHADNSRSGTSKREKILTDKVTESETLTNSIASITKQIETLQAQLQENQAQLSTIDDKYLQLIHDVDDKLEANDFAKQSLLDSINTVINNIKTNL